MLEDQDVTQELRALGCPIHQLEVDDSSWQLTPSVRIA